ncbi:hypothetical protein Hanom_Chr07g00620381 [Helianthus anomalus]
MVWMLSASGLGSLRVHTVQNSGFDITQFDSVKPSQLSQEQPVNSVNGLVNGSQRRSTQDAVKFKRDANFNFVVIHITHYANRYF